MHKFINFEELKKEMPYKYRVQSCGQYNTTLVGYIDARDAEDLLDSVCGPENWCNDFKMIGTQMLCSIGVKNNGEWVFKHDGGTKSNIEQEKGLLSDSFKRAAVKWGIGRFLYRLKIIKLPSIDSARKTKNNDIVYAPIHDVTKYGSATKVPKGILRYNTLQISDVNRYVWEFLEPWAEAAKAAKKK